ncbi:hypothetical protein Anapl_08855 [Anas platyrhynchos]|uniref:Uncharacterized protein n=1 Tax=Anas platyrhynchos TaxID=8839 RepID=R0LC76_ANAPL|nr:hypothetical protein Anapl_08855 [Anas platyrhynchos]
MVTQLSKAKEQSSSCRNLDVISSVFKCVFIYDLRMEKLTRYCESYQLCGHQTNTGHQSAVNCPADKTGKHSEWNKLSCSQHKDSNEIAKWYKINSSEEFRLQSRIPSFQLKEGNYNSPDTAWVVGLERCSLIPREEFTSSFLSSRSNDKSLPQRLQLAGRASHCAAFEIWHQACAGSQPPAKQPQLIHISMSGRQSAGLNWQEIPSSAPVNRSRSTSRLLSEELANERRQTDTETKHLLPYVSCHLCSDYKFSHLHFFAKPKQLHYDSLLCHQLEHAFVIELEARTLSPVFTQPPLLVASQCGQLTSTEPSSPNERRTVCIANVNIKLS